MDDLRPLVDDPHGSPLGRALLASARSDAPSPGARARAARRLGIAAVLTAGAGTGTEAGALVVAGKLAAVLLALGGVVGLAMWQSPATPAPAISRGAAPPDLPAEPTERAAAGSIATSGTVAPTVTAPTVAAPGVTPPVAALTTPPIATPTPPPVASPTPPPVAAPTPRPGVPAGPAPRPAHPAPRPAHPAPRPAHPAPRSAHPAPGSTPGAIPTEPGSAESAQVAPHTVPEPSPGTTPASAPATAVAASPPAPSAEVRAEPGVPGVTAPPPAPVASDTDPGGLAAEVALVDRARARLGAGDYPAARVALDEYHRRFPTGDLGAEADMVMIEILIAQREVDRARRLGTAFLARFPRSPLAQRVRSLLDRLPK